MLSLSYQVKGFEESTCTSIEDDLPPLPPPLQSDQHVQSFPLSSNNSGSLYINVVINFTIRLSLSFQGNEESKYISSEDKIPPLTPPFMNVQQPAVSTPGTVS